MSKVVVLGAGINGLASAVKIKEKYPNADVTIYSNEFTPHTTGDGSGGLWFPYLCGATPAHLLSKWGGETYRLYHKWWLEGGYDVNLIPIYELHREKRDLLNVEWSKIVFGYTVMDAKLLKYFNENCSGKYQTGRTFTTFVVNPPTVLAHLYKRFVDAGGKIEKVLVTSLTDSQLGEFDVVINCLGLGAKEVVPDDKMFPVRGQIYKVRAPWAYEVVMDEDTGHYIIPNVNFCIMGGTHQENNYSRTVDEGDKEFIENGCHQLRPNLKYAEVIEHWVGLRPGRDQIRLESEEKNGKVYIHNYGHGGSGLTLFWGCGSEVLKLYEQHLRPPTALGASKL